MKNAERIQMVINTLERMEMRTTFDNCNMMLGIYKTLAEARDEIRAKEEQEVGKPDDE